MSNRSHQQTGNKLLSILVFTLTLSVMNATIFNIVLPEIALDFHLSFTQVSWMTTAYMLLYAIGTVVYGKLADIYKLKNLLTFGLVFLAFGSMIGLIAEVYWMVLSARILQALGAAVIPAAAGIIPVRYFSQENRGRAFGMVAVGLALGRILSPITTSLIVLVVDWRWMFLLPLFTLILLPFFRKYLNDETEYKGNIDWIGAGLLGGTIALLLLSVTNGNVFLVIGCMILFVCFVIRIRSTSSPFIQAELFRNKDYSLRLIITFLISGIGFSFIFLTPLLLSEINHMDSGLIGIVMAPAAIMAALLGRLGGKLADSKGNTFLFYLSSSLLVTGFVLFSIFAGVSAIFIALFLIFGDVGITFIIISLSNSVSRTLPESQTGVGMGIYQMLNFIAGSVSGAVYGRVVDTGANVKWNPFYYHVGTPVYSNIYFVLGVLTVGIVLFYYFQFRRKKYQIKDLKFKEE